MKKLALALALALAISPLTFAQKTDSPSTKKSTKKNKKGKHPKTSTKTGSLYKH